MNIAARQPFPLDRVENDFYPTDHGFTRVMLESLPVMLSGPILEPCAGERDIVQILRQSGLQVEDTDIIDGPGLDATTDNYWSDRAPDWTITNPPFNAATKILQQAYQNSRRGVLIFLRITYLEPCPDRAEWLDTHADQLRWMQVVNPRPIFRADTNKTDSATCVWLLWDKHWSWLSQGIEPPFRFSHGARCLLDKRRTAFSRSAPKLMPNVRCVPKPITAHKNSPKQLPINTFSPPLCAENINGTQEQPQTPTVADFEASLRESARIGEAIADNLRSLGLAPNGSTIESRSPKGREYLFLSHRSNRRRPKRSTLKGEALALAREQIDRRNQYNKLNHRVAEVYATINKLGNK